MRAPLIAGIVLLAAGAARAVPTCTISSSPVVFGVYDPVSATPLDAAGSIDLKCPGVLRPAAVTITRGSSATYQPRRMALSGPIADLLMYNLYLDAARTAVWGDGTEGTQLFIQPRAGASQVLPVYGRVFALQDVRVGTYVDTVIVQVNF